MNIASRTLAILSAPDGDIIETSYNARWVQPGARAAAGDGLRDCFR